MKYSSSVSLLLLLVSFCVALPSGEYVQKTAVENVENKQTVQSIDDNADRSKRHLGGGLGLIKLKTFGVAGGFGGAKFGGYDDCGHDSYGCGGSYGHGGYGGGSYGHGGYGGGYYGHGGYDENYYGGNYQPYYKKTYVTYDHPHSYSYHPYHSFDHGSSDGYGGSYGYPSGSFSSASASASSSAVGGGGGCSWC